MIQENTNNMNVNGSSDKPYPTERNFNMDVGATMPSGMGVFVPSKDFGDDVSLGQVKYARREGATSIYKDQTRNTANDNAASAKAEASTIYEDVDESEETRR